MSPWIILSIIGIYFGLLLLIAYLTSNKISDNSYFLGNKASPWYIVAFGLIGDSLSGVTFVSVPGKVNQDHFAYFQMVLGYIPGYFFIALVLLPLFYKLNLTSIYSYLGIRFGNKAQKTGSAFFLLSRVIGAAFRLYISVLVLQLFVFDQWQIPFSITTCIVITLIMIYTLKGGIKTLVWTDTLQSGMLLTAVIASIFVITSSLKINMFDIPSTIIKSNYSNWYVSDWKAPNFFWKQFISGAFIAIVMTGLDQNMMQKNLSIRTLKEAQKNLYWFSLVLIIVNLCFLTLGALLYIFANAKGIVLPQKTDHVFPYLSLNHLGTISTIMFVLGITAATFSSADSVLTTLTTSFYVDILGKKTIQNKQDQYHKNYIHIGFGVLLLVVILIFKEINNEAVINAVFKVAGYTYGPLLGLFFFGLFTKFEVKDKIIPYVCLAAPCLTWLFQWSSPYWLNGYQFGFELLLLNGMITMLGLYAIKKPVYSSDRLLKR